MKRIVKRTTTAEEWRDPDDEHDKRRDAAEDEDESEEDADESTLVRARGGVG